MKATKTEPMTACRQSARALCRVLQQDLAIGRRLLAVLDEQSEALMAHDHVRFAALEEEMHLIEQQQVETGKQRFEAIRALAETLGIDSDPDRAVPPLSDLALRVPLPEARRFVDLRQEILAVEAALRTASERTRALLESALQFAQISLEALTRLAVKPLAYGGHAPSVLTFYVDRTA